MKFKWIIDEEDKNKVRSFIESNKDNLFVKDRVARNLSETRPPITIDNFWAAVVNCLLTTQQRSGPDSHVSEFLRRRPFPLARDALRAMTKSDIQIDRILSDAGIRRHGKISDEITTNLRRVDAALWAKCAEQLEILNANDDAGEERRVATFMQDKLLGIGPKQSRNLLQMLGLTKYEIPIDSRITKWLTREGFPVPLSAAALSDESYYGFVSDGIIQLCKECGIFPCVLDASIFASFDGLKWTQAHLDGGYR